MKKLSKIVSQISNHPVGSKNNCPTNSHITSIRLGCNKLEYDPTLVRRGVDSVKLGNNNLYGLDNPNVYFDR